MEVQVIISIFFILYGIWYIFSRFIPMNVLNKIDYSTYPIATGVVQGIVGASFAEKKIKRNIASASRRVVKFKDENGNMVLGIDDCVQINNWEKKRMNMLIPKIGETVNFYYWEYAGIRTIEREGCINEYNIHLCDENYYEKNTKLILLLNIGNIILGAIAIFAGIFILM